MNYPTPHIDATPDDFAKTVLMPGDPLRSKYIAEHFLTDAKLVNNIRGVQGYTGFYKGVRVSTMSSGVGMPAMGVYAYELYNAFEVENIIRVGTIGALSTEVKTREVLFGLGSCCDADWQSQYHIPGFYAPVADYGLIKRAEEKALELGIPYRVGNFLCTERYYNESFDDFQPWINMGVLGVEMESTALYTIAARFRKKALAICTVSNNIVTGEELPPMEREAGLNDMLTIALETAISL